MDTRDFKGVWIPKDIYLNSDLNWTDKLLLIEIDSLDVDENKHGGCFASNAYFAKFLGVTEKTISTSISKLKDLDLIYQASFNGRTRVLKSRLYEKVKADFTDETLHECKGCLEKKVKENNTINNNNKLNKDNTISNQVSTIKDIIKSNKAIKDKKETLEDKIVNYTQNINIRQALKDYISMYNEKFKCNPTLISFDKLLEQLRELAGTDANLGIRIIENSTMKGYREFYAVENLCYSGNSSAVKGETQVYNEEEVVEQVY